MWLNNFAGEESVPVMDASILEKHTKLTPHIKPGKWKKKSIGFNSEHQERWTIKYFIDTIVIIDLFTYDLHSNLL